MDYVVEPDQVRRLLAPQMAQYRLNLYNACLEGDTEEVQRILEYYHFTETDLGAFNNSAFTFTCANGNVKTAQWILHKCKIDQNSPCISQAMEAASTNGRLDVVQWLTKHFDLYTTEALVEKCLAAACMKSHLEVAKWIAQRYRLTSGDVHEWGGNKLPYVVCKHADLETVKWVMDRFSIPIYDMRLESINGETPFDAASNRDEVYPWLEAYFATRQHGEATDPWRYDQMNDYTKN